MAKPDEKPKEPTPKKATKFPKWLKILLLIFVIAALIVLLVLLWQQYQSGKKQKEDYEKQKQELQEKISSLEEELQKEKDKLSELESAKEETITFPSTLKENLEAVLATGNTQPIETYVTNPVTVILAASEAYGPVTPAKAASAIDYVIDAQQPWNCDLPQATLTAWQKGDYKQYFNGSATLACKSKDNMVIAFTVNKAGKITTMFMSASADLLQ